MDAEIQALLRAVAADPANFEAWVAYVKALIRAGRVAEAEEVLTRMTARFGERAVIEAGGTLGVEVIFIVAGAALEVIILFGAGLALPASKWGKLTLDDDADRDKWYALIVALYKRHIRERNAYREGDRRRSIVELWGDADYIWRLVQAFLRRYPDYEFASLLRMIERAAGHWVEEYWSGDDDWYSPAPPPASVPLPPTPPPPPPVPPPTEHPHTVEKPTSFEDWLKQQAKADAQEKRERIARIRKRLRELKRKRRDPDYDYESVRKTIDEFIEALLNELQKLRDQLEAAGEDTGEEFDEPLDPPPPAPAPPWPLGHPLRGYRLYVNPTTGQQEWFVDPPRSDGWEPASNYHWGWVPEVDPKTGKIIWRAGWVLGPESEDTRAVHLLGGNPMRFKMPTALWTSGDTAHRGPLGKKRRANRKK